jgi:hypothetical protein
MGPVVGLRLEAVPPGRRVGGVPISHRRHSSGGSWLFRTALAATLLVFGDASMAASGFTTAACLAQKRTAWGALRQCQAKEAAKALRSQPSDPAKCQTRFAAKLAKLDARAGQAAIACRLADNGDGTVIDYDTGLQWEKKTGGVPSKGMLGFCNAGDVHCVNDVYEWADVATFANVLSGTEFYPPDGTIDDAFAGFPDWRIPTLYELGTLYFPEQLLLVPVDPVFGPTAPTDYWSSTQYTDEPDRAHAVRPGSITGFVKTQPNYVRAVRTAF